MVEQRPFGYLYRTTITIGRKKLVYVGKRQNPRFTEAYKGSGTILRDFLSRKCYSAIKVELVSYFSTLEELNAGEVALVAKTKAEYRGYCINVAMGGDGGKAISWTLERCKADALKYSSRIEWRDNSSAYHAARKRGWLNVCCEHMDFLRTPKGYWTLKRCKADAARFASKKEWKERSTAAHAAAYRNGWLDICFPHVDGRRRPNGYWTLERCVESASKYTERAKWKKSNGAAYQAAKKAGWLESCCEHMDVIQRPRGYWTLDRCKVEARKYQTRAEWQKGSIPSYTAAWRSGWVDECCAHMEVTRKPDGYWTLDRCKEDALKFGSRSAWMKASFGYQAAHKNGWLDICMPRPTSIDTKQVA